MVGGVLAFHEVENILSPDAFERLPAAENVAPEGVTGESHLFNLVEDEFGGRVLVVVDLFQHHIFLFDDFFFGEGGMEEDVGEDFEGVAVLCRQEGGVKAGLLFGGAGVEFAAGVFDALGELVAVAVRGALEEGMFHKVGDAVQVVGFVAGAGVDDDAEVRDGRGHLFVDDADAVG